MRFPRVAFVQSRQSYLVPEGDPFFNEDRVFYGAVQLAMDSHDTVIACGSAVLYRRAALDDIGGFAIWNLVEDLTTSYHLHARGWKSFYYPFALSEGLAPGRHLGRDEAARPVGARHHAPVLLGQPAAQEGAAVAQALQLLPDRLHLPDVRLLHPVPLPDPAVGVLDGQLGDHPAGDRVRRGARAVLRVDDRGDALSRLRRESGAAVPDAGRPVPGLRAQHAARAALPARQAAVSRQQQARERRRSASVPPRSRCCRSSSWSA